MATIKRSAVGIAAFLSVMAIMLAATIITRGVVHDQEQRLLNERSGEVAALLSGTVVSLQSSLQVLGSGASASSAESHATFERSAKPLLSPTVKTVGVAVEQGSSLVVVDRVGDGPALGAPLDDARAVLARRAMASTGLVSDLIKDSGGVRLVLCVAVGSSPATVAYYEAATNPGQVRPSTSSSPYRELDVDLYASPTPDPAKLLLTTRTAAHKIGSGHRNQFAIGADTWLIVTGTHRPLVGQLAARLPWIVLVAGFVVAALVALLVEALIRRRRYALGLVEDRTAALRSAQQAAEAANMAKSEFLSRMSHELRTPLNAVLGFGQLLELDDLTEAQRESVGHILKGGRHLLDLINEVLDISHIEAGRLSLSPEPVLVSELLTDVLRLIAPLAAERSVNLLGSPGGACDVYVFADRQRIKQILLNLLSNGIKYNRPRGSVAVSCAQSPEHKLRIKVTDTGPGISTEDLDRLFMPFERLGAESTDVEGTGIGLALSRRLAEAMGGTIDVDSTHGRGSTFWVELPVVEGPVERYERLEQAPDQALSVAPDPVAPRHRILHIEDNLANLTLVERVLSGRGDIEVIAAMQGRLGLELAHEHRPSLILLDLHLPDVDGDEVLQRLREDPDTASTPVVMVSADATPRQIQRLLSAGATAYLTKPIDVLELLRLTNEALATTVQRTNQ
jgi:signal transduction histidine kinase/CheY-like chemotaxis protein